MQNIRKKFLDNQHLFFRFLVFVKAVELYFEKRTENYYLVRYYTRLWHPISLITIIISTILLICVDVIKTIHKTIDNQVKYYIKSGKISTQQFDVY